MTNKIVKKTTITCPKCGFNKKENMPLNACQHFYNCQYCGELLKPKEGDCCVFCSYGNDVCPPKQIDQQPI